MFSGKSPRWHLWVCLLASWSMGYIYSEIAEQLNSPAEALVGLVLGVVIWVLVVGCWIVLCVRRVNDLGRSRWEALLLIVPIFQIVMLFVLLLHRSVPTPSMEN
jgi:uncharacterized membrane protein YhaH (DUF805 family)